MNRFLSIMMAGLLCSAAQPLLAQTTDTSDMEDVTNVIANAGFDEDYAGWTIEVPGKKISTGEKAGGLIAGSQKHLQVWVGSGGMQGRIFQELNDLPAGLYVLQAAVSPSFDGSVKLYAGENTTEVVTADPKVYEVNFTFDGGNLEIGLDIDVQGSVTIDMDEFRLYYKSIGTEDGELMLAQQQFDNAMSNLIKYADEELADYIGLYDEVVEACDYYEQTDRKDKEKLLAASDSLKELIPSFKNAVVQLKSYLQLYQKCGTVLEREPHYPGYDDFLNIVDKEIDFEVSEASRTAISSHYSILNEALLTYYYSQEASEDNPADYTFLVQYPNFCIDSAEPSISKDGVFSYPNESNYEVGKAPADAVSTGWKTGNSGGDQRLNWQQGRICWNAWGSNFTTLSIQQNLDNLPNGLYTVSADLITADGCLADQHVYAKSSLTEVASPNLSSAVWNSDPALALWETLTTDKIIVDNHQLMVGAKASHPSDAVNASAGWFLVTNFKLNYWGESVGTVLVDMYNKSLANAKDQTTRMQLKGDAGQLQSLIDACEGASTADAMKAAIAQLDSATSVAQTYQGNTRKFVDVTYPALKEKMVADFSGQALELAKLALENMDRFLVSDNATYAQLAEQEKSINTLCTTYLLTVQSLSKTTLTLDEAKKALEECLEIQQHLLWEQGLLISSTGINQCDENLKLALRKCLAAQYMEKGETDYTALIENPHIDGNVTGWTINRPTGNQDMSAGKDYDGVKSGYLNSWNGKSGALRYTAYQTLTNIPNGTYEFKAMFRVMGVTPGSEGVYMYAIADGDTASSLFKAVHQETINLTKYVMPDVTASDGTDSIKFVSDQYGSVWQDAMDRTNMGENVTPGSLDEAILEAGAGWGCGWQWKEMQVVVRNHQLTIGVTCDSLLTNGKVDTDGHPCVPFSGTQFSADEFSLTQLSAGDNAGWTPLTDMANAIEQVSSGTDSVAGKKIYTLDGIAISVSEMKKHGVYIMKDAKTVRKIVVK